MNRETRWAALDIETSDANKHTCQIAGVGVRGQSGVRLWFMPSQFDRLQVELRNVTHLVMHNACFDLFILEKRLGIEIDAEVHDTMLMAKHWRNDLPAYDLKSLGWWLTGNIQTAAYQLRCWIKKHTPEGEEAGFDMTKPPIDMMRRYCLGDCDVTYDLAMKLYPEVKDNYAYQLDCQLIRLLIEMDFLGMRCDVPFLKRFVKAGSARIKKNLAKASKLMGLDGTGRTPTGDALRNRLQEAGERARTASGKIKADESVLRGHLDDPAIEAVQNVKSDQKLVSTYANNLLAVADKRGYFHAGLHLSGASTRRFRASGLYGNNGVTVKGNVQNFPRGQGIRTAIIPPDGFLFCKLDLASIEARLGAHLMSTLLGFDFYCKKYRANDKFNLYLHIIKEHTEHGVVTKKDPIYQMYKGAVLGIQYGMGPKKFYAQMVEKNGMPYTIADCYRIYDTIRSKCPEFSELQRAVTLIIEKQGFIKDDFGAVYYLPKDQTYKGVNAYCQGCAGNVLKEWWVRVDGLCFDTQDYVMNTVHDELDMAIENSKNMLDRVDLYNGAARTIDIFDVPITAESSGLVKNWGDAG
jgi:DNA polymerase I